MNDHGENATFADLERQLRLMLRFDAEASRIRESLAGVLTRARESGDADLVAVAGSLDVMIGRLSILTEQVHEMTLALRRRFEPYAPDDDAPAH